MTQDPSVALRELRDTLRGSIPDVDTLLFELSKALDAIDLAPTSVPPSAISPDLIKAISKVLPAIQVSLITSVLPTFLPALDNRQKGVVEVFFVPPRTGGVTLTICRTIALTTYQTLSTLLTSSPANPSTPIQSRDFVLDTLSTLSQSYSIDELYWAVWAKAASDDADVVRTLKWEEAVKAVISLPAKVANAIGKWKTEGWAGKELEALLPRPYFDHLVVRLESLLYELSQSQSEGAPLRIVIQRLANLGLFNQTLTTPDSPQPSFFGAFLPPLLAHLHPSPASSLPPYPKDFLPTLISGLQSSTINAMIPSLIRHLTAPLIDSTTPLLPSQADLRIRKAATIMKEIVGDAEVDSDVWTSVLAYVRDRKSGRPMDPQEKVKSRLVVAWIDSGGEKTIKAFIDAIVQTWTDPKYVKFALYAQQFHLTHVLLLALSLLQPYHAFLLSLSHQSRFLIALQSYLGHPDAGIRRLGMLVAEIVSSLTIPESSGASEKSEKEEMDELKAGLDGENAAMPTSIKEPRRLKFGDALWDGTGEGKDEARWLRSCVGIQDADVPLPRDPDGKAWMLGWDKVEPPTRKVSDSPTPVPGPSRPRGRPPTKEKPQKAQAKPKIVMLSDDQLADPLEGYSQPSPSSSRSASPTPSFLEEIAADPSLAVDGAQKKTITRPVYIPQLIALLKERDKPDSLEMALKWGEDLIRAKRNFGTELSENAANVALLVMALNDPFNLDDFDSQKQGILIALVACAPRQVAPFLAEQYFINQYSLQQKFIILSAVAMGARELAGLSVPTPAKTLRRVDFPSKQLPPALHRKYITEGDIHPSTLQLEAAIDGVRGLLLSKDSRRGDEDHFEVAREKRLRVGPGKKTLVAEVGSLRARQADAQIASLHDQAHAPVVPFAEVAAEYFIMPLINRFWQHFQDLSAREARSSAAGGRFRGAGSGLVMSPLALEKLLMTLSILLHAGRHSPVFLAVLAPEALELALTVGMRHPQRPNDDFADPSNSSPMDGSPTEAQVLGSALELCLVCLDGSTSQDKGRTLATDKPELVIALGEWASQVFEVESKGGMVAGGQAGREGKIRASAAGVVVKISEIGDRWSHLGMPRIR